MQHIIKNSVEFDYCKVFPKLYYGNQPNPNKRRNVRTWLHLLVMCGLVKEGELEQATRGRAAEAATLGSITKDASTLAARPA